MGGQLLIMKFVIAVLSASVGLVCGVNWVRICEESSGNKCCNVDSSAGADLGMGKDGSYHEYWIIRSTGSWTDLDIQCQLERTGAKYCWRYLRTRGRMTV